MNTTKAIDARGLACPMPIVHTKKAMDTIESGEILEVQVTDKGALADIPAWAASGGHTVLKHAQEDGVLKFWIQKA
ncbi:sulfurtransferase TusA family protein [Psychrobacillus sp. NPDC058041]|uniref:sulfurtransferase TusA family protein n=1 Tax=Psychrobacillus sp. NPDC058041 TaxID=3346310 RepID=UPI0036DD2DA8